MFKMTCYVVWMAHRTRFVDKHFIFLSAYQPYAIGSAILAELGLVGGVGGGKSYDKWLEMIDLRLVP